MPISHLRQLLQLKEIKKDSRSRFDRFRPKVEGLEDRWVMTAVHWINPAAGFWADPASWSTGAVPGPDDDVVLDAPGDVTVIHPAGDDTVHSIAGTDALVLSGGSLSLAAASNFDGSLELAGGNLAAGPMLTVNGPLLWTAGNVDRETIVANGGLDISGPDPKLLTGYLQNAQDGTLSGSVLMLQGGEFANLPGATLDIQGSGIQATDSNNSSGIWNRGQVWLTNSAGLGAAVTNDGDLEVLAGGLGLGGYLDTVTNNGTIEMNGGNFGANGKYFDDFGSITGAGNIGIAFAEGILIWGPVTATGDMNLSFSHANLRNAAYWVGGTLSIDAVTFSFDNATVHAGAINLMDGYNGAGIYDSDVTVDSSFRAAVGFLSLVVSNSTITTPSFNTSGYVEFRGATLTADSVVNDGVLTFDSSSAHTITDITNRGYLTISGSVSGNLVNAGWLAISGPFGIGQLAVGGDFTQTATGHIELDINGNQSNQLNVGGTAYLDGTLAVSAPRTLVEGDSFQAITFANAVGSFARYDVQGLDAGLFLDPVLGDDGLTLVVRRQG